MEVIKTRKDRARAKSLIAMAEDRLGDVGGYKPYKKVEEYWDIAKELILAIMHAKGYNTLSHRAMVEWLDENFPEFSDPEIRILDMFRRARNDISYYGKRQKERILFEYESSILKIINKLLEMAKSLLK